MWEWGAGIQPRPGTGWSLTLTTLLDSDEEEDYLGVRIQLRREQVGTGASGEQAGTKASDFLEWWVIELQDCQADCNLLPMVIFSDKVSPPSLGFLAGYG